MSESTILQSPVTEGGAAAQTPAKPTFEDKLESLMNDTTIVQSLTALPVVMMNDYVEVEIHKGVRKRLSYSSFKELINKALNQVDSAPVISGMLLPSNTLFISQTQNELHLTVYHPGGNRDMLYGTEKMHIVTPNIIISFSLKKDKEDWLVSKALYYCTDLPVSKLPKRFLNSVSHEEGIYDLPMSNTYGGGTMCYGSNQMPARFKDGNLRGLDWYYRYLWETPFNNDLGVRAIKDQVSVDKWYELLAAAAKAGKIFPYVDLYGYKAKEHSPASESVIKKKRSSEG